MGKLLQTPHALFPSLAKCAARHSHQNGWEFIKGVMYIIPQVIVTWEKADQVLADEISEEDQS